MKLEEIEYILDDSIQMDEPNQNVLIHEGEFCISGKKEKYKCHGKIQFEWLPKNRVVFEGSIEKESKKFLDEHKKDFFNKFDFEQKFHIEVDGLKFGNGFITGHSFYTRDNFLKFYGFISNTAIKGDKSISVSKIKFSISNLKEIVGLPINFKTDRGDGSVKGRIKLKTSKVDIIIDRSINYDKRSSKLSTQGGYVILYNGEITSNSNSLSFEEYDKVTTSLSYFLSFLNGANCSCTFVQGIHDNKILWEDFTSKPVDTYKSINSWHPIWHDNEAIQLAYDNFNELWKDKNSKNFLSVAIHWYIQSNRSSGDISGAIILAQTGIELIFNYWIVEQKKMIIGKDAGSVRASNKLRLLLSQIKVKYAVDEKLKHLSEYCKEFENDISAPEILVEIRNSIVHSTSEKLEKVLTIPPEVKFESLQLMIKYIELSILKILNYDGKYFDRCSNNSSEKFFGRIVPWTKEPTHNK
jgi:hypothetical protein